MNPFEIPQRTTADLRPLCPWDSPEHGKFYVPVDNTQVAFQEFIDSNSTQSPISLAGRTVLLSGSEGCGKTALMNRCAHWLAEWLKTSHGITLTILDLTLEGIQGIGIDGRVGHICSRVIDELELRAVFTQPELDALDKRRSDASKAYPYLSRLLANASRAVAILLPSMEVREELSHYANLAKRNLIFFCESSYEALAEYADAVFGSMSATPIIHLSVGVLSVEDGWTFVESRMQRASVAGVQLPTVTSDTIKNLMEVRIKGRGKMNMRELQMACLNVFQDAISRKAPSVRYADFADYYLRNGSLR